MSPSKLAWHFQAVPGWAAGVVNSDWVKVIDPPGNNLFPAQKVIGRVYIPDDEANAIIMRGAGGAEEWFARCLPAYDRAAWAWCWEGPNEPPVATPEQRGALVAFTRRWVQLMHARNLKTVALCLGVGWPDIGQAADLAGALEATDYWAVHEYSAPTMQSDQSWLCLRYRRTVGELRAAGALTGSSTRIPPLLITECGIDGGVIGRPGTGWKTYADRAGYLTQLMWYDGELRLDDYVQAATIFTSGPNANWTNFNVDERLSRDLAAYIEEQRETPPTPPPPQPPAPTGSANYALQRPLPAGAGWVAHWFGESATNDYPESGLAGHNGLDYSAPADTPVLAAHAGQAFRGEDAGYGKFVRVIAANNNFWTIYAHLQDAAIADGQQVKAGGVIGRVGSTGKSSEPRLHLGWRVAGVRNPAYGDWIDPYLGRKMNGDA